MAENEKTSKSIASIASKILKMNRPIILTDELWVDIKKIAGSTLTQAPDKKPLISAYKKYCDANKVYPKSNGRLAQLLAKQTQEFG